MAFDANAANTLTVALTNLNTTLAMGEEEKKAINYPSYSERGDENIIIFF